MRERYQRKAEEIKTYQKEYRKSHQQEITEARRPYQRRVYLMNRVVRRLTLILFLGSECAYENCSITDPMLLHFHHKNPEEKSFELGRALNSGARLKYPWPVLLEEAKKCELLCSNHHTLEHNTWTEEEKEEMYEAASTLLNTIRGKDFVLAT